jgi:hypothetical protein
VIHSGADAFGWSSAMRHRNGISGLVATNANAKTQKTVAATAKVVNNVLWAVDSCTNHSNLFSYCGAGNVSSQRRSVRRNQGISAEAQTQQIAMLNYNSLKYNHLRRNLHR